MTKNINNKKEIIKINKAIIPVAGYGTRLYPFTKIINKEFLPIIDKGMAKPQIGVREICLSVSGKKQINMYKDFFCKKVKYNKSIENDIEKSKYEKKIIKIGKCLKFIVNKNINTYEQEDGVDIYVTYEVLENIGTNEKIVF